ncbi:hypothetical protein GCM10017635_30880 [Paracoccus kondratievae]|uniref:DNA methylase N-4/N-6 domain-containing protein n=1 Tax=Paracoccus kondratievae TaxID=135740 RepID=A0AAD3RV94_9RHOB|nr:hypothetical protein GCM10017635_30880 [Paracoccus kondratievae]
MTNSTQTPRNVIFNADCIGVMRSFDRGTMDFILTDPPYVTNFRDRQGRTVANDDNGRWLCPAFNQMHRVLKDGGFCVSFYALQTRDMSGSGEELYSTENRATADGLAGLPRDYTGPVLGPALPGDLGGPILDPQNRGQPVTPPAMATPARDPAEERRLAEEEAARVSRVFFQTAPGAGTASPSLAGLGLNGQTGATGTQDRHTAFLNGPVDWQTVSLDRIMAPASPYILQAGAVIPAAMITGIRSDLPGQITAQVTENVYDSPTGSRCLTSSMSSGCPSSTTGPSAFPSSKRE